MAGSRRGRQTSPSSRARSAACVRSRAPSLPSTLVTWFLTVPSARNSAAAISRVAPPGRQQPHHVQLPLGQRHHERRHTGGGTTGGGTTGGGTTSGEGQTGRSANRATTLAATDG